MVTDLLVNTTNRFSANLDFVDKTIPFGLLIYENNEE